MSSHPAIKWHELFSKFGHDAGFVKDLLGVVVETNCSVPASLREAARSSDLPTIEKLAHRVKGTAGDLVAHACQDLARQTELAARDAEPSTTVLSLQLADALDAMLDEVRSHLAR